MPLEIERKYLVDHAKWNSDGLTGTRITQGYITTDPVVRVRMTDDKAWITIKSSRVGLTRSEFEYAIPRDEARDLLRLCDTRVLDKTRYVVEYKSHTWEVDVFHGDNEGLITAEIELPAEDEPFEIPPFVQQDVSTDPRYANSNLVLNPFRTWRPAS